MSSSGHIAGHWWDSLKLFLQMPASHLSRQSCSHLTSPSDTLPYVAFTCSYHLRLVCETQIMFVSSVVVGYRRDGGWFICVKTIGKMDLDLKTTTTTTKNGCLFTFGLKKNTHLQTTVWIIFFLENDLHTKKNGFVLWRPLVTKKKKKYWNH